MRKRKDELDLIDLLKRRYESGEDLNIRGAIRFLQMNVRRAAYILFKWTDKGQFEYGVSPFGGWFTDKGLKDFGIQPNETERLKKTEISALKSWNINSL